MRLIRWTLPLVLLSFALLPLLRPRSAGGVPLYAARTGLMCQSCHFDPNGGGPRNEFGFAYARNRHALEAEPDTNSAWHDLAVVNRVAENVPLYFGLNQRFMLLANTTVKTDSVDRLGFYNMENAIHLSFQPHSRLTLVYSLDAFATGNGPVAVRSKEAFGMISGFPWEGYLKAGRIRIPFGLRMDDHTVATRNGFLDFQTQQIFLPYDVRRPDMGIELGGAVAGWFGRAAFTNGRADALGSQPFAQTATGKLGFNRPNFQGAVSFYDDFEKADGRFTRWGGYVLTHYDQFALIGEAAAGTDRESGEETNSLAGFLEADWAPKRALNFRVRADFLQTHRDPSLVTRPDGSTVSVRDLETWERFAVEGEIVPVPFAELRWTLRLIHPKVDRDEQGFERENEKQAYLQLHFSY